MSERWWRRRKRWDPWFSPTLGLGENPRFRRFGGSQSNHYGNQIREQLEPLVDVIENDEEVVIVAGLQGVKKDDIQIHATQCNITISVDTLERKYHKELALPDKTEPESAVATYKNGVLQVRLRKLIAAQPFVT